MKKDKHKSSAKAENCENLHAGTSHTKVASENKLYFRSYSCFLTLAP